MAALNTTLKDMITLKHKRYFLYLCVRIQINVGYLNFLNHLREGMDLSKKMVKQGYEGLTFIIVSSGGVGYFFAQSFATKGLGMNFLPLGCFFSSFLDALCFLLRKP